MNEIKQTETPMTKERLKDFYKAFNKKGYEYGVLNYFSEDVVYENPAGLEISGRDNVIKYMIGVHHGDKIKETITPVRVLIEGVDAAAELVIQLDALEDALDHHIASLKKGDQIAHRVSAWYTIRDGKIAKLKVYPPADLTPRRE